jgi:hypothetical protein
MSQRKRKQKDLVSLEAANREVEFAYGATRIICCMELPLSEK